MGDRANVCIVQHGNSKALLYLYTHWGGEALPRTLQAALRRKLRWTDEAYLARIIFCEMIRGYERTETGFGIATSLCDNEHPILVVDCDKQTVGVAHEGNEPTCYKSWSFSEFIELDLTTLPLSGYDEGGY